MKVSIYKRPKGVVLTAEQSAEVEVRIPEVTTEVIEGRTTADDEALKGERPFQKLDLIGTVVDSETAEKAVRELLKIRELVVWEEKLKLGKLETVAEFISKALKDEGVDVEVD